MPRTMWIWRKLKRDSEKQWGYFNAAKNSSNEVIFLGKVRKRKEWFYPERKSRKKKIWKDGWAFKVIAR